jgi:hypothetical protein
MSKFVQFVNNVNSLSVTLLFDNEFQVYIKRLKMLGFHSQKGFLKYISRFIMIKISFEKGKNAMSIGYARVLKCCRSFGGLWQALSKNENNIHAYLKFCFSLYAVNF